MAGRGSVCLPVFPLTLEYNRFRFSKAGGDGGHVGED